MENILRKGLVWCFVVLFAMMFVGCKDGDLSRGEAEKIIKKEMPPVPVMALCSRVMGRQEELYGFILNGAVKANHLNITKLNEKGLLEIREDGTIQFFVFTEEGKRYVTPKKGSNRELEIMVAKPKSLRVDGIVRLSDSRCKVEYVVEFVPTPFGEVLLDEMSKKLQAELILYDDGWRLKKNKIARSNTEQTS